ncbi:unnamed protein product [Coregonus sp. 'balchen']|nr:unnamed protein product [Coregonus sp. 'balchen']
MESLCQLNFEEDINFWGLRMRDTPRCCRILFEEKELIDEIKPAHVGEEAIFKTMFLGVFCKALWDLMENPYSPLAAKGFAVFSSLFVLFSIVAMTLNTVKELRKYTIYDKTYMECVAIISIVFFTFEYFLRLLTTCDIKHFVKNLKTMARVSKVLKVVKLMRIFRILKLAKHSTGMQRLASPSGSGQSRISTVGYGDMVPISYLGRCVAFGCISFGIILNGIPISIFFNKFSDHCAKLKAQEYDAL